MERETDIRSETEREAQSQRQDVRKTPTDKKIHTEKDRPQKMGWGLELSIVKQPSQPRKLFERSNARKLLFLRMAP